jgi:hypothetical protein
MPKQTIQKKGGKCDCDDDDALKNALFLYLPGVPQDRLCTRRSNVVASFLAGFLFVVVSLLQPEAIFFFFSVHLVFLVF